jgi:hypothetical protein
MHVAAALEFRLFGREPHVGRQRQVPLLQKPEQRYVNRLLW